MGEIWKKFRKITKNPLYWKKELKQELWATQREVSSLFLRSVLYLARILYLTITGFFNNRSIISATALAYTTLLAIVPLLAVMFSLFQAFGGMSKIVEDIKPFIFENLTPGSGLAVYENITAVIQNIHTGAVGIIGLVFLILTAVGVLSTVEKVFNETWRVKRARPFSERLTLYWSILTLGPILVAASISLTAALQSSAFMQKMGTLPSLSQKTLSLLPFFLTYLAFFVLYYAIPNTRVRVRSALVGTLVAGSLFELAKWGYAIYATKALTYSNIYGSLGAIPVFLVWLYVAWLVVLIGAELAYADQHIRKKALKWRLGKKRL